MLANFSLRNSPDSPNYQWDFGMLGGETTEILGRALPKVRSTVTPTITFGLANG